MGEIFSLSQTPIRQCTFNSRASLRYNRTMHASSKTQQSAFLLTLHKALLTEKAGQTFRKGIALKEITE